MSRDIWTFIEYKDIETNLWKPINIYIKDDKGEFKVEPVYTGNADYNLFNVIWDNPNLDGCGLDGSCRRIPFDLGEEAAKFFDKDTDEFDNPRNYNTAWFDWVELQLLQKTDLVMVPDYWVDAENPPKVNGMEDWYKQIEMRLAANNAADANPGEVRILTAMI